VITAIAACLLAAVAIAALAASAPRPPVHVTSRHKPRRRRF
jgi:hypothetical protein